MLSAGKTPACTGWLWCWVLPPSHWGPSPGSQQAINSLVNLWNERPSEVLHYRLPRGWFAFSFLINWTLPTNNILICKRKSSRLGHFYWSFLKNTRQCGVNLVEGCALLQLVWRVWQQTAPQWCIASQEGETSMRCKWAHGFLMDLCSACPFPTHASEVKTTVSMCVST